MEDVYRDWDSKIAKTILMAGIPSESVDDIKSEIYLSMVRRDLCSKFDPERARSFSTYLYTIVHSLIANEMRKYHRKKYMPVRNVFYFDRIEDLDRSNLFLTYFRAFDELPEIERVAFVEDIVRELELPKNHREIQGRIGSISLKSVVLLAFQGHSLKDIAGSIGAHPDTVKKSLMFLKRIPAVKEYYEAVGA
ncbi:Sigma-70 region 2 [uncultured archaeon]|nr:Sigma-70 region 2 [uncultured archaeon]